ncbi:MAG: PspC domain-containing protein [Candidatus Nanoarchaeia archaeon]|jgi:phage shock protein C
MKDKIYKSKNDKIIFGVCAGIADYFEIDPTIVRVITAVLLIIGAQFIISLYIILALVLPENPAEKKQKTISKASNSYMIGAGLVIIGVIMLLDSYNIVLWRNLWPAMLIIIGVIIIWGKSKKD